MKLKCENCSERATLHITEIEDDGYRELHFCFACGQKYLRQDAKASAKVQKTTKSASEEEVDETEGAEAPSVRCPYCKTTFADFRSAGRLGCPHDYQVFRADLEPLLKSIHDRVKHSGKTPKRMPADIQVQTKRMQLRQDLQQAVAVEDYERAARIRDQIESLGE